MQRMAVDFPEPDGPQITIRSPFLTVSEMSFSTWKVPYHLLTFRISIITAPSFGVECAAKGETPVMASRRACAPACGSPG